MRELRVVFVFLLKLLVLAIPFHVVITYADLSAAQATTARHVHGLLALLGTDVQLNGALLRFDGFDLLVSRDSTGWKSVFFLAALLIATRSRSIDKLTGLFVMLPAVYSVNLFRVVITAYSGFYGVDAFNLLHDVLWQIGMVAAVLLLWLLWLKKRLRITQIAHILVRGFISIKKVL